MNNENLKPRVKGEGPLPGAGRPKGSLNVKTVIGKFLNTKEKDASLDPTTGKMRRMTQLEFITLKQLKAAREGELAAFNALLDRYEGKPKQINELTGPDGATLQPAVLNVTVVDPKIDIAESEE